MDSTINIFSSTFDTYESDTNVVSSNNLCVTPLSLDLGASFPVPFPSNTPFAIPFPPVFCKICGGHGVGKNCFPFCKSCREFFSRAVRRNKIYRCGLEGKCSFDPISNQFTCKSCKLKKCLENGMDANRRRSIHVKIPKEPIVNIQTIEAAQIPLVNQPTTSTIVEQQTVQKLSSPQIQFMNMIQVTESFLSEVVQWPKKSYLFEKLSFDEKIELVENQWIRILIVTISENGAHLLDLPDELSTVTHAFHGKCLSNKEVTCMKLIILFMMIKSDGKYRHQSSLECAVAHLKSILKHDPVRFEEIKTLIESIAQIQLGGIQVFFLPKVLEFLSSFYKIQQ